MAAAASDPASAAIDGGRASPWTRSSSAVESAVALWNGEAIEISVSRELATARVALSEEATVIVVQNTGGEGARCSGRGGIRA